MARKELYDDFIRKSRFLTLLIQKRFAGYEGALNNYGTDPPSHYLELKGMNYEALMSFLNKIGSTLRGAFQESLNNYSKEILGEKPPDYYDNCYFFRSRVFKRYAEGYQ